MRYYSATVPRYCSFRVTPETTDRGIRYGYMRLCLVLGMNPNKRKNERTAAEQRAVSGYGQFVSQVKASGYTRLVDKTAFTVSDLNQGAVILFIAVNTWDEIGMDLDTQADVVGFSWKPPIEKARDRAFLSGSADMSAASDTLNGDFVWLMTAPNCQHEDPGQPRVSTWEFVPFCFKLDPL
jgi:hypothetical protein